MKYIMLVLSFFLCCSSLTFAQRDINSISDKLFDLKRERRYDEAIADLNNLIEANPNNPKLYIKKAEFLGLQNKLDEAIVNVSKAIDLEPTDAMSYIERAKYFNLAKNNKALLKDVQTAVSISPDEPYVLIRGTEELSLGKQYEESIKITDFYIARRGSDDWLNYFAYKIRGENKYFLKDYVGALEDIIKSIDLIPFTGDVEKDFRARM